MPFTLTPILKATPRRDKTQAVLIRLTKGRVHAYLTTGVYVLPRHWNPNADYLKANWVRGYPMAGVDNHTIKSDLDGLKELGNAHPALSASGLRDQYRARKDHPAEPEQAPCFVEMVRREIGRRKLTTTTREGYRSVLHKLERYTGGSLPLPALTVSFLNGLLAHLQGLGNSAPTVHYAWSVYASVARTAMAEGILEYAQNPFHQVKASKGKRKVREALPAGSLQRIMDLPLGTTGKEGRMALARDIFLTQYFLHGGRIGDALELKWEQVQERLRYRMRKNQKDKSLPLPAPLAALLERYRPKGGEVRVFVFPVLDAGYLEMDEEGQAMARKLGTMRVNFQLGKLATLLGLPAFTSHVARHTFAREALRHASVWEIKALLNHSSVSTTEHYLEGLREGEEDTLSGRIYAAPEKKTGETPPDNG